MTTALRQLSRFSGQRIVARRGFQSSTRHHEAPKDDMKTRGVMASFNDSMPGIKIFVAIATVWCVGGMIWSYSPPFLTSTKIGHHIDEELREDKLEMDYKEGVRGMEETGEQRRQEAKIIEDRKRSEKKEHQKSDKKWLLS